jgi:hypothetical protein
MKKASLFGAVALALSFAVAPAKASVVFQGSTEGCFNAGCTLSTTAVISSSHPGDTSKLSFGAATAFGPSPGVSLDVGQTKTVDLGTFKLTGDGKGFGSDTFTLEVLFTSPSNSSHNFTATLSGNLDNNNAIKFSSTPLLFSWSGESFTLLVNSIGDMDDHSYELTGRIHLTGVSDTQVAAVPEPATWAMMLMGFAGVGFVAYRRRTNRGASFRWA